MTVHFGDSALDGRHESDPVTAFKLNLIPAPLRIGPNALAPDAADRTKHLPIFDLAAVLVRKDRKGHGYGAVAVLDKDDF